MAKTKKQKQWNPLADLFEEKLCAGFTHVAQGENWVGAGSLEEYRHILCFLRPKGIVVARLRIRQADGGMMLAGSHVSWHSFENERVLRHWALNKQKVCVRDKVGLKTAVRRLHPAARIE